MIRLGLIMEHYCLDVLPPYCDQSQSTRLVSFASDLCSTALWLQSLAWAAQLQGYVCSGKRGVILRNYEQ